MTIRAPILFCVLLSVFQPACGGHRTVNPVVPVHSELDDAFTDAANIPNLKSLVVYKDDRIVREEYFGGCNSNSVFDVRSVTKTVMSTLIGIAIDKGFIQSEDRTLGYYREQYGGSVDSSKRDIRIRDLLSMSSGLSADELANPGEYDSWFNSTNQVEYTLNLPLNDKPGTMFTYNSGVAHLTSAIISASTGMNTLEFARRYLFQPLNISDHSWQTDKQGIYNGGAGLSLTAHDMIRLGVLFLNRGMYNGKRVISEEWIDKATSTKISTRNAQPFGPNYGYFWWIGNKDGHEYFWANGYGGQFVVVVPDLRLVVAATNTWAGVPASTATRQWNSTIGIIMNNIVSVYSED